METQITSVIPLYKKTKLVTIFGYSTKGVPGIELSGLGKFSKTCKEKVIYLTRMRRLSLPLRRYVICVDNHNLDENLLQSEMKWLEFPILLCYWHLAKIIPLNRMDDCLTTGTVSTKGEVTHRALPSDIVETLRREFNPIVAKNFKHITTSSDQSPLWSIDSEMLLEVIPDMQYQLYLERDSATPI
jgi:hypothetical protein